MKLFAQMNKLAENPNNCGGRYTGVILRFGELKQYYEPLIFLFSYGTIENTKLIVLLSVKLNESVSSGT